LLRSNESDMKLSSTRRARLREASARTDPGMLRLHRA
jgi:hypothetical protein